MEFKPGRFDGLLNWVDWIIPDAVDQLEMKGRSQVQRRSRLLVFVIAISCVTSVVSSLLHFVEGDSTRAVFTTISLVPILLTLVVLRFTANLEMAVHYLCGFLSAAIVASPFLSQTSDPIFVGMIAVPMSAALVGGARLGVMWTVIASAILAVGAAGAPLDTGARGIAWMTVIMAGVCGTGVSLAEFLLTRALDSANEARQLAEERERERAATEAALTESQALFSTAFHQAPTTLVLSLPESGVVLDVNQSFEDTFGFSRDEAIGSTMVELGIWPSPAARERYATPVLAGSALRDSEIMLKNRAGESVWLLASAEPLEINGHLCMLSQGMDITDRKRSDELLERRRLELERGFAERGEQLKASQAQLRETERLAAVGTLAAGIAHQINNPIGGIVAASEFALMSEGDEDSPKIHHEALETARDEAKRCGRIVKSVLKFARDEPTPKWVEDLNPIVRRASELARSYVEERGGLLTIETTQDALPAMVSPIDIEQVVLNLVRNAAESRTTGVEVRVRTLRSNDNAEISITDNGRGILEEERAQLFDPFYTTRLDEGGTGLGLSVVHGVVGDHAGKLEIESMSIGGSKFRVMLPIAPTNA